MPHFETYLMVLSQKNKIQTSQDGKCTKNFDEKKTTTGIAQILDFLFEMSFDKLAFKVLVFAIDLEF